MTALMTGLARGLHGSLVLPGDPGYESARTMFVRSFTEVLPRAVVRCADPADVAEAIAFAHSAGLPFALRGGGHSFADYSSTGGLLIDLGGLGSVDVGTDTVTVGPGVTIGTLATRLAEHDRVVPCGWCPTVGVTGAALGGGFGMLGRLYGLGADHIVAATVVLADGRTVRVDRAHEPDLFWALRGAGGGNFGAVTALELRTRPAPALCVFTCRWPYSLAPAMIDAWQRWAPTAPDEINAEVVLRVSDDADEPPLAVLFGAAVGTEPDTMSVLTDFADRVGEAPSETAVLALSGRDAAHHHTYAGEPVSDEPLGPPPPDTRPGFRVNKSEFFTRLLPRAAIAELTRELVREPVARQRWELEFIPWAGAIGRIPPHATAFAHRAPRFMIRHSVHAGCHAPDERRRAGYDWTNRSWAIVHPWGSGHVYPNYPDPDLTDWPRAYHGPNLTRLRQIKARYDPADRFHCEQSIRPAGFPG